MTDGPTFIEMIVSQLGTPKEPFGFVHAGIILGLLAIVVGFERGLLWAGRKVFRTLFGGSETKGSKAD